jgi:hypothetical protein
MLVRNNDSVSPDLLELVASSGSDLIASLVALVSGTDAVKLVGRLGEAAAAPAKAQKKMLGASTVGSKFRAQIAQLRGVLGQTRAHFVRCIKPNTTQSPRVIEAGMVTQQLVNLGKCARDRTADILPSACPSVPPLCMPICVFSLCMPILSFLPLFVVLQASWKSLTSVGKDTQPGFISIYSPGCMPSCYPLRFGMRSGRRA